MTWAKLMFFKLAALYLGFRKRNKPQTCLRHKNVVWFVSLPEAQKAPPKECKQLHAVEMEGNGEVESAQALETSCWRTLWRF